MNLFEKNIETLLDDYLFGFSYEPIAIADFFNNFINKPAYLTKNQLTRSLQVYCKKRGYEVVKKSNGLYRYYDFKPCLINVDRDYLTNMRLNERIVIPNTQINGIAELLEKAHYFTPNKFIFEPCSELYHSLHRIA